MLLMNFYNCFNFFHILLMMISMALLPVSLYLLFSGKIYLIYWSLLYLNSSSVDFPIIIDFIGVSTSMVVVFISSNVLRFASTYMFYEENKNRFNYLVLLFVLSMNILIFVPNLIILLLGWDGLGLISFLLVIYYQNSKSLSGGMITALTNRVGDAFMLIAIGWSLNLNNWSLLEVWGGDYSFFVGFSVVLAAMTKSAQFPFSSWLPAAMAAPTPVSALVHSSTLVTAGVFLLVRFHSFLSSLKFFESFLLFFACVTMVMAALCAIFECDLKKIIALSTLSQLGVMMTSLAVGVPLLALFHLITHALFKALLFVCAGSLIFLHSHNQDLRLVGNIFNQLPLVIICFGIGSVSLCGLPFLSGFYSKDLILELMLNGPVSMSMLILALISTGGTALYSVRLMMVGITGPMMSGSFHNISSKDKNINVPIFNLTLGAIFGGAFFNWFFLPLSVECFLVSGMKLSPFYFTLGGLLIGSVISFFGLYSFSGLNLSKGSVEFFSSMWFLSPISSQMVLKSFSPAYYYLMIVDHGWMEVCSAQGGFYNFNKSSLFIQPVQSNMINIMLSLMLLVLLVGLIL